MLVELHVTQLGVVEDLRLLLGEGMTAVTGETGAGKTLLIEAIRLLTGGRAESHVVRAGATEACVEGRFVVDDEERVLTRVVPVEGRSRAYIDGRMVPLTALAELGEQLVDLHAQHAHQALLAASEQRRALDAYGRIDLSPLREARAHLARIDAELAALGGDAQARAREVDLLRYQLEEIDAAQLTDADEDDRLRSEADLLIEAGAHREAAAALHAALADEGGVQDALGAAVRLAGGHPPLCELDERLRSLAAELSDVTTDAAAAIDRLQDDPERLTLVQERRQVLKQLQRKYGNALADVIEFRDTTRQRLADLEQHDERVASLDAERARAVAALAEAEARVRSERARVAPELAGDVEGRLRALALPHARFQIDVGLDGAGDDVTFLLGPNPGMPMLPVAKAASGGELARSMLALRLSLMPNGLVGDGRGGTNGKSGASGRRNGQQDEQQVEQTADVVGRRVPTTLIFDEVDAGIGGEAAVAVGRALSTLAGTAGTQVLVVTHLPQVAAFADHQVSVSKQQRKTSTIANIAVLDLTEREVELARMLSGRPDSDSGRAHARELLQQRHKSARPR